jgi:hypothetical protein
LPNNIPSNNIIFFQRKQAFFIGENRLQPSQKAYRGSFLTVATFATKLSIMREKNI